MPSAVAITRQATRVKERRVEPNPLAGGRARRPGAPPDEELIARVCWREEPALGEIYDRYGRLVYSVVLRIVGDRGAAEEVVQDVFQAVWQSAGSFQPTGSFTAWLIGIARHRAIDATRSRRYRSRAREDMLDDTRLAGVLGGDSPADALLMRSVVRGALDQLPASQRQAIELAYYGGLTHTEIAARLGEPVGTVKSRMRIGLLRLRQLLQAADE
jgi:RNA polymerase sigma-70 factor (ECF subfamily)